MGLCSFLYWRKDALPSVEEPAVEGPAHPELTCAYLERNEALRWPLGTLYAPQPPPGPGPQDMDTEQEEDAPDAPTPGRDAGGDSSDDEPLLVLPPTLSSSSSSESSLLLPFHISIATTPSFVVPEVSEYHLGFPPAHPVCHPKHGFFPCYAVEESEEEEGEGDWSLSTAGSLDSVALARSDSHSDSLSTGVSVTSLGSSEDASSESSFEELLPSALPSRFVFSPSPLEESDA